MQFRSGLQLSFDKKKTMKKLKQLVLIITMNIEDTSLGKIPLTETTM